MIKLWNPTTQFTLLNNYLSNYVITSSYISSYSYKGKTQQIRVSPTTTNVTIH
jgi:hypothetical protein